MAGVLGSQSGLAGISGLSGDVRDLEKAAAAGNARARLALDVFVHAVRHYLGAFLVELGGVDVAHVLRRHRREQRRPFARRVCAGLEDLGIVLDAALNAARARARPGCPPPASQAADLHRAGRRGADRGARHGGARRRRARTATGGDAWPLTAARRISRALVEADRARGGRASAWVIGREAKPAPGANAAGRARVRAAHAPVPGGPRRRSSGRATS